MEGQIRNRGGGEAAEGLADLEKRGCQELVPLDEYGIPLGGK